MKRLASFLTVASVFCGSQALSSPLPAVSEKCAQSAFMPENKLHEMDVELMGGLNQAQFDAVLTEVESYYKPIILAMYGATLQVTRDWQNPLVNAYATQSGKIWELHMYGGLARRPEITPDGFEMVACHEMGHHLGGFPFAQFWASNEGQADYFAALSCTRTLWAPQKAMNALSSAVIPAFPKSLCDAAWLFQDDRNLCYRIAIASKSLADLLSQGVAKYETPDRSVVAITDDEHPSGQCRLDTYLAGAVCGMRFDPYKIPPSELASVRSSCMASLKEAGFKPRCWFKPTL